MQEGDLQDEPAERASFVAYGWNLRRLREGGVLKLELVDGVVVLGKVSSDLVRCLEEYSCD